MTSTAADLPVRVHYPQLVGHARALLAVISIWLLFFSFHPFRGVGSFEEFREELWQGIVEPFAIEGMLKHLAAVAVLGCVLSVALPARSMAKHLAWTIGVLLVLSVLIEIVQAGIPRRHCRAGDVLIHTGAGVVGWAGAMLLLRATRFRDAALRAARPLWLTLLITGVLASVAVVTAAGSYGSSLANWNHDYPLVLGNEHTGDRPWAGRLHGTAMYPLPLDPQQVASIASESSMGPGSIERRRELGALLVLTFDEGSGSVIRDVANGLNSPELRITPETAGHWLVDGAGFELNGSGQISTTERTDRLNRAIQDANAFSVEVVCEPDNLTQLGPARIVSLSKNVSYRNMTLGQNGSDLVFRVRTPLNGRNGARLPGIWSNVFINNEPQHIVVTYDGEMMRAYIDGKQIEPAQSLQSIGLVLGLDRHVAPFMAATTLFLPLGVCSAMVWSRTAALRRLLLMTGIALTLTATVMVLMWLIFHWPAPSFGLLLLAIPAISIGDLLGSRLARPYADQRARFAPL